MNVHAIPRDPSLSDAIQDLESGQLRDPFNLLGPHETSSGYTVRAYFPGAADVRCLVSAYGEPSFSMRRMDDELYDILLPKRESYRFQVRWQDSWVEVIDPYGFPPQLSDFDLHLIAKGEHLDVATKLGANLHEVDGIKGVLFAVWAPNAHNVSVVGDFNSWDPRRHPMRLRGEAGVWELFIPGIGAGEIYKFAIRAADRRPLPWKADPFAKEAECPPRTGSVVADLPAFAWTDTGWLAERPRRQAADAPISIYEVHVGSWLALPGGHTGGWDEAIERLIPYVRHMGFTHIELMPITEHPFGGSWGYQPLSLFAPTSRLGSPEAFMRFVDRCHAAGIGVILDWVPAHFPADEHGMGRFDGTALFEHEDPREGFHLDWNTLIYNFGRWEVRNFLIASALWWIETYHLDGLRVDAVASMLYRDYSRPADGWIPNRHGGRENLEAVAFLQDLNRTIRERCPGTLVIAEESTAWPGVTAEDGLGFQFKWNMGWMHDTLRFFGRDPIHRGYHLNDITFGLYYGFSEAFVLPLSHDEVVHGKGSLLARMPGDDWQKFANLRLLLSLMWTHPGKKLLFMGCEFGATNEWNADAPFPWPHPDDERRQGLSRMVQDLNGLLATRPQLHSLDRMQEGFAWIIDDDWQTAVFAFRRSDGSTHRDLVILLNATPVPRVNVRIGVPRAGQWAEVFNSDSSHYGGSNVGNGGRIAADGPPLHGQPASLGVTLPPLGLIILEPAA